MNDKLIQQVAELKKFLVSFPDSVNLDLIRQGKKCLSIFSTQDFGFAVKSFNQAIMDLHMDAIIDLSHGGAQLAVEKFGIALRQNEKLVRFSVPANEPIPHNLGKVVCSIGLNREKNAKTPLPPLTQDQLNACIYFLIYRMSQQESTVETSKND